MRIAGIHGRPHLIEEGLAQDLASESGGRFTSMQEILDNWVEFLQWVPAGQAGAWSPWEQEDLTAPVPHPRQVFCVGLNYEAHAKESDRARPQDSLPTVFTKFPGAIIGPYDDILLPTAGVDLEVELVAVIGVYADSISQAEATDYVAGVMVGQDISERAIQRSGQLTLSKSFRTFAPTGPAMCTLDECPADLNFRLRSWINDSPMQDAWTRDMTLSLPALIELLSSVVPLYPGDLIFTGTPAGVGVHRDPPRFLVPGDEVRSEISTIGAMHNRCAAASVSTSHFGSAVRSIS